MHQFKRRLNGQYVITFIFILAGIILLVAPPLKGAIWQTIGVALIGSGFTILISAITARQSISEQYRKDANLQRKTNVYGPLHSDLKDLREIFDEVHNGRKPYPWRIDIAGEQPLRSPFQAAYPIPMFSCWPAFRKDYRIDDFTPTTQRMLDDVQNLIKTYNKAVEAAREATKTILRQHLATSIEKEAQRQEYQEWQRKRSASSDISNNRWFQFIDLQTSAISAAQPVGTYLSQDWTRTIGWFLADNPDQAAQDIYSTDAINWDASQHASLSWFQHIFQATENDLKIDPTYKYVISTQKKLFQRIQEAEKKLEEGLRYIRDRYEGGTPPI